LTPTPSSILVGTPQPGDQAKAVSIATQYQTLIRQGNYAGAWAMLGPEQRSDSYTTYQKDWTEIAKSWGSLDFTLGTVTHDWQSWDPTLPKTYAGDYSRAFIIVVDYPFTSQTNFWGELLVMPTVDETKWEVVFLR
jgi:hypothetical protein